MSNEASTIEQTRTKIQDIAPLGEEMSMEELELIAGGQATCRPCKPTGSSHNFTCD